MNPFYFGPSDRPLFGLFTRGRESAPDMGAVLLCYPVGSEYMRAHRAFRQLNTLLNRVGFHVLRFDYSCTGDSAGEGQDARVADWLDDVTWAIEELEDTAMVDTVSVVGLRWGATLAALATRGREDVDRLILWDPVVSGSTYLDAQVGSPRPTGVVGIEGYPYTAALREEMDAIDLRRDAPDLPGEIAFMVAEDRKAYREYEAAIRTAGKQPGYEVVPAPGDWAQVDPFGDALIPQDIIQAIIQQLSRGRAT